VPPVTTPDRSCSRLPDFGHEPRPTIVPFNEIPVVLRLFVQVSVPPVVRKDGAGVEATANDFENGLHDLNCIDDQTRPVTERHVTLGEAFTTLTFVVVDDAEKNGSPP
jgi:hypothetical protein